MRISKFVSALLMAMPFAIVLAQPVSDGFDFPVGDVNGGGYNTTAGWGFLEWTGSVFHPAEDFNRNGTSGNGDLGDPVYAVSKGRVLRARNYGSGWGNIVLIEHLLPDGSKVWSQYAHLNSMSVTEGSDVSRRQQIGTIGNAFGEYLAHLHFEIRKQFREANAWVTGWSQAQILEFYEHPSNFINSHRNLGTPPLIELYNLPTANRYFTHNVQVPWRVTQGTDPVSVWEIINSADVAGPYSTRSGFVNHSIGGTGWKVCWARVTNAFGSHTAPQRWDGGFDNALPEAARSSGALPSTWYSGSPTVTWLLTDSGAGPRRTRFRWNGGAWSAYTNNPNQTSRELLAFNSSTGLLEGQNTLEVEVEDNSWTNSNHSGNLRIRNLGQYWLDTVPPVASAPTFNPTSPSNADAVTVTVQAVDALSGVQRIELRVDGNLVGTVMGASGNVVWDTTLYTEGSHSIQAIAFDMAGNTDQQSAIYFIDRIAPTVTLTLNPTVPDGENGWYITVPTGTLSPSDSGSGVASVWYRLDTGAATPYSSPFQIPGDGEVEVSFWAIDAAGNSSQVQTQTVKVDTSPPDVPVLEDEGDRTSSRTALNVSIIGGGDPDSGISMIDYRVGSTSEPQLWRADTQVQTRDPWLFAQGLFMTTGELVFVELRVRNGAGQWSGWAQTDGIEIDPSDWPMLVPQSVLATGGLSSLHPEVGLGATIGEAAIGDAIHPDLALRAGFWATLLAFTQFVHPDGFTIVRGVLSGGGLPELRDSDDQRLSVKAGLVLFPSESPAQITVTGTSPVDLPREIRLLVESRANTPGLAYRLELFNFDTGQYELVGTGASETSDSIVEAVIPISPGRFVEEGTRAIRVKVNFFRSGLTLLWPWTVGLDQVLFKIKR